jgi:pimeloyl-ACP methyl ester carboxylesterase
MGAAESMTISTGEGRLLEALVSGPPDGTVLVLHTGTPCGLVPLPAGLDPAPMGIRIVMYARPGYGRSTPQAGRTVADAAGDTAAILDALGADTFLNVGWSGGGPHALACDALLADRCLATAVIAGLAPYTEAEAGRRSRPLSPNSQTSSRRTSLPKPAAMRSAGSSPRDTRSGSPRSSGQPVFQGVTERPTITWQLFGTGVSLWAASARSPSGKGQRTRTCPHFTRSGSPTISPGPNCASSRTKAITPSLNICPRSSAP